jgi:CheY-like chemotaxis protein/HPt (histidine-containing phosphotransfer) domain-containing protein
MTAILGFAEMLGESIEHCAKGDGHPACTTRTRIVGHLGIIRRNGEHLLALINDIVDLSKIEAGKMEIELVACSPAQLVAEVTSLMRIRAAQKGLHLETRYEFPLPETIRSDPTRIRQVLTNLVGNAVKFTSQGRVEVALRCDADGPTGRMTFALAVKDTGIGMTPEQVERLFQPFTQADSSVTRQYGGTGLGLTISKRLAETLGGRIAVESRFGEGSTFTFTFAAELAVPCRMLHDLSAAALQAASPGPAPLPAMRLRGKVLLAEDGPDNRVLISAILRKAGVEVETAENGRVAVEKALARRFDAILMDMQMPQLDGYQATRQLRQSGYRGPIIALTAHAMAEDCQKCLAAGCDEYLTKPVDRAALLSALAQRLSGPATAPAEGPPALATPGSDSPCGIESAYADDPDMVEVIDGFVAALPERIGALLDSFAGGDYETLERLAHQLKGAGGSYGYPLLTQQARKLEQAARALDAQASGLVLDELRASVRAIIAGHHAGVG